MRLHFDDIKKLLGVVNRLVDAGNTMVVIEHNLDVIKTADWIIEVGREGGHPGDVARMCYICRPMSTTTIRLPVELKARVADAARRSGTTPHAFILAAIAEKADADQRRAEFEQLAEGRYQSIVASDQTIPWGEMRRFMRARVLGKRATRPSPRKLSR